jgi:hypothetical protein
MLANLAHVDRQMLLTTKAINVLKIRKAYASMAVERINSVRTSVIYVGTDSHFRAANSSFSKGMI